MARAIRLAERGLYSTDPNPRVGCVLVKDSEIVGEGWHVRAGEPHAEIHALRAAGAKAKGATAYVSLEPCSHHGRTPPCADALIDAGVARVVAAMEDPNPRVAGEGMIRLRDAGIDILTGIMASQAAAMNPGFIKRMQGGLPYVRLKLAMSLDGRTALASGESRWITSEAARADVHHLRARSSAIVTGIGTVLADNPSLNARPSNEVEVLQPLRVVLDSQLQTPATARMLSLPGNTLVLARVDDVARRETLQKAGAEVSLIAGDGEHLDLSLVLAFLAKRNINEVLVEAGPTLSGAMLQAGLVDELIIYMAPVLLGDMARGLMSLPGLESMSERIELEIVDMRAFGRDWKISARVKPK
jgi:diaminohydroxyphosphoribosylaminopyrimidine deaminase/5-amino-6-(5-phosphoribosylamino)uracil reductase